MYSFHREYKSIFYGIFLAEIVLKYIESDLRRLSTKSILTDYVYRDPKYVDVNRETSTAYSQP